MTSNQNIFCTQNCIHFHISCICKGTYRLHTVCCLSKSHYITAILDNLPVNLKLTSMKNNSLAQREHRDQDKIQTLDTKHTFCELFIIDMSKNANRPYVGHA